ncbi:hypothetical protein SAMN05880582_1011006 [Rhizobium sp. RU20A]|uniref:hypothetical protein n=1 Tax=Rhizobium sp. RU20A TaxID=1907412 RepID=UPI0009562EF7|nr:hypothetical protein [Rhizobium sp. RU20A]SIQ17588.1 hypothetical protein SAMN05880582_1011006 [Rhizobium sp. RU20A]
MTPARIHPARRRSASWLAIGLAAVLLLPPVTAEAGSQEDVEARIEAMHGNMDDFWQTFDGLRESARGHDAESIAAFAEYPLTVNANGETYDIQSARDFVDNFDAIVTQDTLDAITGVDIGDLLVNGDGVAIGDGTVWLAAICDNSDCSATHWAITAINN